MARPCSICTNKVRAPIINAALDNGVTNVAISRNMTETGWAIGPLAIGRHRTHYVTTERAPGQAPLTKRDLLEMVRDKTIEAIEDGRLDIEDQNWSNVRPGMAAVAEINKQANRTDDRKMGLAFAVILAGGSPAAFLAPAALRVGPGNGEEIEGEFEEVDDDDDDAG